MAEYTLIVHGWSDSSQSFKKLREHLSRTLDRNIATIILADYQSREDSITFNDVVDGFHSQLIEHGYVDEEGNKLHDINIIVHSTGALVIRHWLWRYYTLPGKNLNRCPLQRFLMLAPANFGSPLAHRGKSYLGSLVKGRWKIGDLFEVGRNLLDGLELASAYQWDLAEKDLITDEPVYHRRRIKTMILCGLDDYTGIRGWINKPGTDGTVVIAGTNLSVCKVILDFRRGTGGRVRWAVEKPDTDIAFGVLPGLDHGTIVEKHESQPLAGLMKEFLTASKANQFERLKKGLEAITEQAYAPEKEQHYQQFIIRVLDDHDAPVNDYNLEFSVSELDDSGELIKRRTKFIRDLGEEIGDMFTRGWHKNTNDPCRRRMLVNYDEVNETLDRAADHTNANLAITATLRVPKIDQGIHYNTNGLTNLVVYSTRRRNANTPAFLYPNTTTLVEIRIDRATKYVTLKPRRRG